MPTSTQPENPVELFYSYSHKDEKLRKKLESHLHGLKRQGVISGWHDRCIVAGADWRREIDLRLETAGVILLLISSDYIESDYCYGVEMAKALERYEAGKAKVIPVLLRPCEWRSAPFGKLQALPANAQPVTEWKNRDKAFLNIAEGVRQAVEEVSAVGGRVARGADVLTPTYSDISETEGHGRWVIVISATISEIDLHKIKAIEAHLRKLAEDTELTVMRIEEGSVVLVLEGTRSGFERIRELLEAGRFNDLLGYEVLEMWWGFDETHYAVGRGLRRGGLQAEGRDTSRIGGKRPTADSTLPNEEAFGEMLTWLEPDIELADKRYQEIRQGLILMFRHRGVVNPEQLADTTIEHVTKKVSKVAPGYVGDPVRYFYGVAHHVYKEYLHRSQDMPLDEAAGNAIDEWVGRDERILIQECMQTLTAGERALLLSYYEEREERKALAQRLNISAAALRVRVYRLRRRLLECVGKAREQRAERVSRKK